MRASSVALIATQTAMDVRRVLSASSPGRVYLYVLWISMAVLFGLAFWLYRERVLLGWLTAYAAFGLAREPMTLRGTFELQRRAQVEQP